jgi:hypothetical protein
LGNRVTPPLLVPPLLVPPLLVTPLLVTPLLVPPLLVTLDQLLHVPLLVPPLLVTLVQLQHVTLVQLLHVTLVLQLHARVFQTAELHAPAPLAQANLFLALMLLLRDSTRLPWVENGPKEILLYAPALQQCK